MSKNFRMSQSGFQALLLSEMVQKELDKRASKVARQANANAPVGETGELSNSHYVESDKSPGTKGAWRRGRARVVTDKPYATKVEAETGYFTSALDGGA